MPDDEQAIVDAPPPPGTSKVEITVGGHTVVVESAEPLSEVVGYALGIYDQTKDAAKRLPFGFDVSGGQFERAEPYLEPSGAAGWEDEHAGRLDRKPAQDGTTRRLVVGHPPGDHRTRLRPLPVDPGRQTMPGPRY